MGSDPGRERRIQTLFLQPVEWYGLPEVANLTETPIRTLRREVARGFHDAVKVRGTWRFTWSQAACIALERWSVVEIHDALGADATAVLPPLLAPRAVTVRLPEYMVRALEKVAEENQTTLEGALHGELLDFAGTRSEEMETTIPGYRRAYFFPGRA